MAIWVQGECEGKPQPLLLKNHETMRFYNIQQHSCVYAHPLGVQPPQDLDAPLLSVVLQFPPSTLPTTSVYQHTRGKEKARQEAMLVCSGLSVEVRGLDHTTTGQRLLDVAKARGLNGPGLKIIRKRFGVVLDPEKVIEDLEDGETFEASIGGLSGGGTGSDGIKDSERFFDCVFCGKMCKGWGHNPRPVFNEGRCCDKCNETEVIRARIYQIVLQHRAQAEDEEEEESTVGVEESKDESA